MRKYHIDFKFWLILILFSVITMNILFNVFIYKTEIMKIGTIFESDDYKITLGRANYLLPNNVIFDDINVFSKKYISHENLLYIPKIKIKISLFDLVFKRHIIMSNISIYSPKIVSNKVFSFLKDKKLYDKLFISNTPDSKLDLNINVKDAQFPINNNAKLRTSRTDFTFNIKSDYFFGFGETILSKASYKKTPLEYELKGFLTGNGAFLENIELRGKGLEAKLFGEIIKDMIKLKGYAFVQNVNEQENDSNSINDFTNKMTKVINDIYPILDTDTFSNADFKIFDIDSSFKFKDDLVEVQNVEFLLNDVPVKLEGNLILSNIFSFNLDFYTINTSISNDNIKLSLDGNVDNGILSGDGILTFYSFNSKLLNYDFEKLEVYFKNLSSNCSDLSKVRVFLKEIEARFYKQDKTDRLVIKNIDSKVLLNPYKNTSILLSCPFYGGILNGNFLLKDFQGKIKVESNVNFEHINLDLMDDFIIMFSKVGGKLNINIHYDNNLQPNLTGNIYVSNGYFEDITILDWFSEFFDLPNLKRVEFKTASSDFNFSDYKIEIDNINLLSDDIRLAGVFSLSSDDLINSKFSLNFSKEYMIDSPHFKPLIKRLGDNVDSLCFDFKLSGSPDSINFQWVDSEFKSRVEGRIPNFVQRKIEKTIESSVINKSKL